MDTASGTRITVIIPALDEAASIGRVLGDLPWERLHEVIVVDNGSTDETIAIAEGAGARVLREPRPGYGWACSTGAREAGETDVFIFLDGDYSDYPDELPKVAAPILYAGYDFVVGSRVTGSALPGALLPQARFGNWLATGILRVLYGARFTDLGPFRAITREAYLRLNMEEMTYGWTVEMQLKAAILGLKMMEVPVSYRPRIGTSKVTGTVRGSVLAGIGILRTLFVHRGFRESRREA